MEIFTNLQFFQNTLFAREQGTVFEQSKNRCIRISGSVESIGIVH